MEDKRDGLDFEIQYCRPVILREEITDDSGYHDGADNGTTMAQIATLPCGPGPGG